MQGLRAVILEHKQTTLHFWDSMTTGKQRETPGASRRRVWSEETLPAQVNVLTQQVLRQTLVRLMFFGTLSQLGGSLFLVL